jgi:single-strand DNA-binding protein
LATNRRYKDAGGAWQEATEYHNIVVFGRQAENCAQYLRKGDLVFVEGRLQTRSWDREGQKQYRTEVVAERVQFGPRGGRQEGGAASEQEAAEDPSFPEDEIDPEDIPF